ncbi:MAG: GntR family transcriptional regulator [Tenuifilaceae bacterium]|jgi:DNA-binding GntR family transcriptional regulator|nr:GntR family transcriptional regulator [Tenuifilaceae bacterium]
MYAHENIPTYFRIYQKLKRSIINGEFEKGSKIGAISELAKDYGVAPETIRKAIHLLETDGLLIRKQGFGTIIPESANLSPLELVKLITNKKVTQALLESKVCIYSAEWIAPSRRFMQLYGLDPGSHEPRLYKIFHRIDFSDNFGAGLCGLVTHHFSENMLREINIKNNSEPYDVLYALCNWMDSKYHNLTETVHPQLCVDEDAKLLDLADGTPVFYQEYFIHGHMCPPHLWSFISSANTLTIEKELNIDKAEKGNESTI